MTIDRCAEWPLPRGAPARHDGAHCAVLPAPVRRACRSSASRPLSSATSGGPTRIDRWASTSSSEAAGAAPDRGQIQGDTNHALTVLARQAACHVEACPAAPAVARTAPAKLAGSVPRPTGTRRPRTPDSSASTIVSWSDSAASPTAPFRAGTPAHRHPAPQSAAPAPAASPSSRAGATQTACGISCRPPPTSSGSRAGRCSAGRRPVASRRGKRRAGTKPTDPLFVSRFRIKGGSINEVRMAGHRVWKITKAIGARAGVPELHRTRSGTRVGSSYFAAVAGICAPSRSISATSTSRRHGLHAAHAVDLQKVIGAFDVSNGDGNRDSRPTPHGT